MIKRELREGQIVSGDLSEEQNATYRDKMIAAATKKYLGKDYQPKPKAAPSVEEEESLRTRARAQRAARTGYKPPEGEPESVTRYGERMVIAARRKYLGDKIKDDGSPE